MSPPGVISGFDVTTWRDLHIESWCLFDGLFARKTRLRRAVGVSMPLSAAEEREKAEKAKKAARRKQLRAESGAGRAPARQLGPARPCESGPLT